MTSLLAFIILFFIRIGVVGHKFIGLHHPCFIIFKSFLVATRIPVISRGKPLSTQHRSFFLYHWSTWLDEDCTKVVSLLLNIWWICEKFLKPQIELNCGKWSIEVFYVIIGIAKKLSMNRYTPKSFCTFGS